MKRRRQKSLRGRIVQCGVRLSLFSKAGWHEGFRTPGGKVVIALECQDAPEDVLDTLESYGITDVLWHPIASGYVYW